MTVINYGQLVPGIIPLWTGEGDRPTPDFISDAAALGLSNGETFYTWQRGIPQLRQALSNYHRRVYGKEISSENFFVTGSGMQSIQIAAQALAGKGDEVIVPTPVWPNISAALNIMGAMPRHVPLDFSNNGWSLDVEKLAGAINHRTRAIFVNSPGNPTGWIADRACLIEILALARKHGLWIIADEIYNRFVYRGERACSFYDIAEPQDRIFYVNTFSKNWAMTGWRVGWISAPAELGRVLENLIQNSTSGVAAFMQRGAISALENGDEFLASQIMTARASRDVLVAALMSTGKVECAIPEGAFYLFFRIAKQKDATALALRLIDEAKVGLAPGGTFGPGGEGFLRACFLRNTDEIRQAADRLVKWLETADLKT